MLNHQLKPFVIKDKDQLVIHTVYPKKYAHGFRFAVLCCGYTLTGFPISIRLTSLALWQSNDCPSASKATLMNMDKYFMWIHYERLHNHNKAKHNKTVAYFLGYTVINIMVADVPAFMRRRGINSLHRPKCPWRCLCIKTSHKFPRVRISRTWGVTLITLYRRQEIIDDRNQF